MQELLRRARPTPEATHIFVHAEQGFTTNLPLADLDRPETLLAWKRNGEDLKAVQGAVTRAAPACSRPSRAR